MVSFFPGLIFGFGRDWEDCVSQMVFRHAIYACLVHSLRKYGMNTGGAVFGWPISACVSDEWFIFLIFSQLDIRLLFCSRYHSVHGHTQVMSAWALPAGLLALRNIKSTKFSWWQPFGLSSPGQFRWAECREYSAGAYVGMQMLLVSRMPGQSSTPCGTEWPMRPIH